MGRVTSIGGISASLFQKQTSIKRFLCNWFGGGVCGICFKDTKTSGTNWTTSLKDVVVCPDCLNDGQEIRLKWNDEAIPCPQCGNVYRIVEDILLLLPSRLLIELYPEFAE